MIDVITLEANDDIDIDAARESIRSGIAAYDHEQRVLLRWFRMRGEVSQHQFDDVMYWRCPLAQKKLPNGKTVPRMTRLSGIGISGDSFILGGMGGHHSRDWWLDLLQKMMLLDLVDTETRDGVIYYRCAR